MKARTKKYEDISPVDFLVLRDALGLKRYRKSTKRNEKEKKMLLDLGIKKIKAKEKDDFIPLGYRKRKLKIP
jgi:hypothetical protein